MRGTSGTCCTMCSSSSVAAGCGIRSTKKQSRTSSISNSKRLRTMSTAVRRFSRCRSRIEQARDRLRAFAQWQAARALQGWDIVYTEHECEIELHLDDGRIAKVLARSTDRPPSRRQDLAILDYKTGEQAKSPRETHVRGGEWVDLQLPLYRLLPSRTESAAMSSWGISRSRATTTGSTAARRNGASKSCARPKRSPAAWPSRF